MADCALGKNKIKINDTAPLQVLHKETKSKTLRSSPSSTYIKLTFKS